MCKEGWCVRLGQGGGNFLKYLKRGGTENREGKTNILKRGGQTGSRDGWGHWNPLNKDLIGVISATRAFETFVSYSH